MGEVVTEGPEAEALLQRLLSNDLDALGAGGAQYSVMCREDGGVLDDLFTYRLAPDRYLTVTNSANHERDFKWMRSHSRGFEADVRDAAAEISMLAIQGPDARELVDQLVVGKLPPRMHTVTLPLLDSIADGAEVLVCGTGYTGEDGVEVLIEPDAVAGVLGRRCRRRRHSRRASAPATRFGSRPASTSTATTWTRPGTRSRPGSAGVARRRRGSSARTRSRRLARRARRSGSSRSRSPTGGFRARGTTSPRDLEVVGEVTSGTFSPCLEQGIGMAYVRSDLAEPGTEIEIDVRGKRRPARTATKPLYEKKGN